MTECHEYALYPEGHEVFVCWLDDGHDGPHHDTADHVMWELTGGKVTFWPEGEAKP